MPRLPVPPIAGVLGMPAEVLGGLAKSVESLQESVGPLGRIAKRLPGGQR
jgi:hypothetical protein